MQRKLEALERKLSAIHNENNKLKKAADGEIASQATENVVDINELQFFYELARKLFKEDDTQVVAAKQRLDNARAMSNWKETTGETSRSHGIQDHKGQKEQGEH